MKNRETRMTKRKAIFDICVIFILNCAVLLVVSNFSALSELMKSGFWGYRLLGALVYIVLFICVVIIVKIKGREPLSSIGLHFRFSFKEGLAAMALGVLLFALPALPALALGYGLSDMADKLPLSQTIAVTAYFFIFIALVEESVYRGLIFHRIKFLFKSRIVQYLITALLFSFSHVIGFNWMQFVITFITSIGLCLFFDLSKSKSILPLILAHGITDALAPWIVFLA